ncbi:reverse transcriptase [Ancylostoma duodenale]|uniref:Reverse transcriptase n=1 Tax=Ancylostoma duodenale TaxID=51022 RepID=A0A0C2GIL6_9BILA|nr:reverse transcriptase [Ancylostoma duodenale]
MLTEFYKKGDPGDITNYRPISLLSMIYKVMTKVIRRRLEKIIGETSVFPPEQAGFRKKFSTVDHIHTVSIILEKSYEYNVNTYLLFVDFTKAFDRVELPAIWQAMESFGIEEGLIKVIELLYANGTAGVKVGNRRTEINIQRGVRQGDSLSPLLFILTLQYALNNVRLLGKGFRMEGALLSYLAYADDVVLLAHNCEDLQALADTSTPLLVTLLLNESQASATCSVAP